jgi:hypothetical protein
MAQNIVVSATIVDKWGTEKSVAAYAAAATTATIAQVLADAQAYYTALDAVTDGYIKRVKLSLEPVVGTGGITGLKTGAVATGATVEQTGLLNFSASGTTKRWGLDIPAVSDSVMTSDRLTLTAGAIPTLVTLLKSVGTALTWCNDHSQDIVALIDALVSFRKSRKQLQRSSFETP